MSARIDEGARHGKRDAGARRTPSGAIQAAVDNPNFSKTFLFFVKRFAKYLQAFVKFFQTFSWRFCVISRGCRPKNPKSSYS